MVTTATLIRILTYNVCSYSGRQENQEGILNLEPAVGRKTAVYDIGVHGEIKKIVVTSVVMRLFVFYQVRQELARTFVIQLLFLG